MYSQLRYLPLPMLLAVATSASAQNFVDLDFSQNIQATNAWNPNNSTLGPNYYAGIQLDFKDVAFVDGKGVDARVSLNFATSPGVTPGYEFIGYIPDYNPTTGGGDLGVYYRSILGNTQTVTGGISYTISFFEGGSEFNKTQTLSDVRFLIYDHDGEPGQDEGILTYLADGMTGYQIGKSSGIHAHHHDEFIQFDARGENHQETNADGGFLVYYQNTSSIRFDMYAITQPWLHPQNNGVFAAFDGDLSVVGKDISGFHGFVAVPEPSTSLLGAGAVTLALFRRGRRSA